MSVNACSWKYCLYFRRIFAIHSFRLNSAEKVNFDPPVRIFAAENPKPANRWLRAIKPDRKTRTRAHRLARRAKPSGPVSLIEPLKVGDDRAIPRDGLPETSQALFGRRTPAHSHWRPCRR